jgi:ATP-dependent RNA helicase DDX10/DBP4
MVQVSQPQVMIRLQGFRATLDAILQNLPRQRQTMLFSATQTKSVSCNLADLMSPASSTLSSPSSAAPASPQASWQHMLHVEVYQQSHSALAPSARCGTWRG